MRMLSDKELAERIYGLFGEFSGMEETTTARLLKRVRISPEELLPVGDLTGVHHELMQLMTSGGKWRAIYTENKNRTLNLPYNTPYKVEEVGNTEKN